MTQEEALDVLKLGHNVYLTGSAGSGKTYVLNKYIEYLRSYDVEIGITASTGIAATHMGGVTIHSWSGLGVRDSLSPRELDALEEKRYLWKRFERAKVLIIDEVSMLHHFRLDLVDEVCRSFKRSDLPFGGMQVVLCGDFFQLPPVARGGEPPARFIYHSQVWQDMDIKVCYLHEQFRQKDGQFLDVLQAIRTNSVSQEVIDRLRERNTELSGLAVKPTRLFTHNADVDAINTAELEKLPGEVHEYGMVSSGREHIVEILKKSCLAPGKLQLKEGAEVMFVKNNFEAGYVNGTRGKVVGFDEDGLPVVKTVDGKKITASPAEWQIAEEEKVLAKIAQVPLRLAWAITVHKSQGMSLDAVEVDLSKSFELGMGYVALSRVRSLDGLKLVGFNEMSLQVDPDVLEFDESLRAESEQVAREVGSIPPEEKDRLHKKYIDLIKPADKNKKKKGKKLPTHHVTKELIEQRKPLKDIAAERKFTVETVIGHIEKLLEEGEEIDIDYLKYGAFNKIPLQKILDAFKTSFEKNGDYRLSPVKDMLGSRVSFADLRLARLFL